MATFEEFSSALYHHAGSLLIQRKDSGPDFTAKIPGSRGGGIGNMAIFCFDLMLTKLLHEQTIGPGFLVHDSHLFDPVDSRQVSSALELGAKTAAALGIQYIVLLNTNDIPSVEDRPAGFDIEQYINPIRLKDTLETGGLFGFRFGE
jgi:uncharacterized protein YydD (DUF2326 family)